MKSFRIKRIEDYIPGPASDPLFLLPTDPADPMQSGFVRQPDYSFKRTVRYAVQMKHLFLWITVKSFQDEDEEWARMCAEELLDKLNEEL